MTSDVKVSLIATVKDASAELGEFLSSVAAQTRPPDERSEERRVGKECRSRWSPYH